MLTRRQALAAALCAGASASLPVWASPASSLRDQLWSRLENKVRNSEFADAVASQSEAFPEGDLFPCSFPIFAAAAQKSAAGNRLQLLEALARQVLEAAQRRLPDQPIASLKHYASEGTYLGQLLACINVVRLAGSDRYEAEANSLTAALTAAVRMADGGPIESRAGLAWPVDTLPALVGLVHGRNSGAQDALELIELHAAWTRRNAHGEPTGLPASAVDPATGTTVGTARGCDLSLRVALLAPLDPVLAADLYSLYKAQFWQVGAFSGFREWPKGVEGPQNPDSGLIVGGLGMAATGLGLAAARAVGDAQVVGLLEDQLLELLSALPTLQRRFDPDRLLPFDRTTWMTGSAVGDASLLFSLSWTGEIHAPEESGP